MDYEELDTWKLEGYDGIEEKVVTSSELVNRLRDIQGYLANQAYGPNKRSPAVYGYNNITSAIALNFEDGDHGEQLKDADILGPFEVGIKSDSEMLDIFERSIFELNSIQEAHEDDSYDDQRTRLNRLLHEAAFGAVELITETPRHTDVKPEELQRFYNDVLEGEYSPSVMAFKGPRKSRGKSASKSRPRMSKAKGPRSR